MSTQIRPAQIVDECTGNCSPVRVSYRVMKRQTTMPVMLHVCENRQVYIGYGCNPNRFSLVGNATAGTGRDAVCRAANVW